MDLFEAEGYKPYLSVIAEERGKKADWATALGCQRGYITAVLTGASHFSLEQAEKLGEHLHLNAEELDYFLMLVQRDRAGTASLREHFERKMADLRERRNQLRHRYRETETLNLEQKLIFYSSWHYSAVHLCFFVGIKAREAIGQALGLSLPVIDEAINFLMSSGMIVESANGLEARMATSFLPGNSPLTSKNHINWRLQAIRSVEANHVSDLHYSSVFTVTKKDFDFIRRHFLDAIDHFKKTVSASKEETEVCCLTLDLFNLTQP